ncbi:lipoprotein [Aestuariibacter salexigens]|uniref:lipoprotein n=1 Tax=Aestuariibacter salexigens TaxID=226010 RepID=UPI0004255CF2|nr:lipoprotein [Aestuariibacter salexigens]
MKKVGVSLLALAAIFTLSACTKMTKENYDALKMGMSKPEVEAIIGSADSCEETLGTLSCLWGDEKGKYIKVSFAGESAVFFDHGGLE